MSTIRRSNTQLVPGHQTLVKNMREPLPSLSTPWDLTQRS